MQYSIWSTCFKIFLYEFLWFFYYYFLPAFLTHFTVCGRLYLVVWNRLFYDPCETPQSLSGDIDKLHGNHLILLGQVLPGDIGTFEQVQFCALFFSFFFHLLPSVLFLWHNSYVCSSLCYVGYDVCSESSQYENWPVCDLRVTSLTLRVFLASSSSCVSPSQTRTAPGPLACF